MEYYEEEIDYSVPNIPGFEKAVKEMNINRDEAIVEIWSSLIVEWKKNKL